MCGTTSGPGVGAYPLLGWSWPNIRLAQPIRDRPVWGLDFHTVRGGINPGDTRVRPRVVGVVDVCMDSDPGMGGPIVPGLRIYHNVRALANERSVRRKSHFFFFA